MPPNRTRPAGGRSLAPRPDRDRCPPGHERRDAPADGSGSGTRTAAGLGDNPLDLLTVAEVAELLRVSESWMYISIKQQRIPALRIGGPEGPIRFLRGDLLAYVRSCAVPPHAPDPIPQPPRSPSGPYVVCPAKRTGDRGVR